MRKYEAVFILDPRKVEGDGEAFSDSIVENFKNNGGTVERVKNLERKTFARPIGRHTMGIYWDYVVSLPPDAVAKIKDQFRFIFYVKSREKEPLFAIREKLEKERHLLLQIDIL